MLIGDLILGEIMVDLLRPPPVISGYSGYKFESLRTEVIYS